MEDTTLGNVRVAADEAVQDRSEQEEIVRKRRVVIDRSVFVRRVSGPVTFSGHSPEVLRRDALLKALTHKRKTTSIAKLPHSARIKTGLRPLRSEKAPQNPVVKDDRMPISRLKRRA